MANHQVLPVVLASSALLVGCPTESPDPCSEPSADCAEPFVADPNRVYGPVLDWPRLAVNEFMASNKTTLTDPGGRWADWVELANPTDEDVDLARWTLSDDPAEPDKHALDALLLPAGGRLLLWADDSPDLGPTHLSFSLDAEGEALGLYAPDGTTVDLLTFGPQAADVSLARVPDVVGPWTLASRSTPGETNGDGR